MSTDRHFDPTAELAGPPDPWAYTGRPSLRSGPPYHMTEMIAAEPALGRPAPAPRPGIERRGVAGRRGPRHGRRRRSVIVTGCGTSEHAAQGVAEILREALGAAGLSNVTVRAEQALEVSLDPPSRGLVIGISHEGGTGATNAALAASRAAGARTAIVTVSRRSPAGAIAEIVVETGELDQSWCHTIGYLSPMLAAAQVGALLSGRAMDVDAVTRLLAAGRSPRPSGSPPSSPAPPTCW